ncbi:MAG TPA: ATP-binding protein [Desulfuromonadales bacterium]|nr:ATP-binding protein [Desulfuromonadales bacterium]
MESTSRYFTPPADHFFLLGPRGTGKTWLTQRCFPDALRIDLLEPETLRSLAARPERLRELLAANPGVLQIVIDEVQKLPELLEVAHLLIEEKQGAQFIFTGSSARKLRRSGVNLLGGRAVQKSLHPFMAAELGSQFNLEQALRLGMLPVVRGGKVPEDILRAYNGLYLREEVQMEGLVRNIGGFSRFLEAISFSQAAVLNLANVARECHIHRKTVEGYLEILEDLLLSFRVPVFTRRAQRELAAHPKFYFFDAGVFRANRPAGPLDSPAEIDGAALEGLVAQHLRAWCDYSDGNQHLYYWQTRSKVEVDFIVYGDQGFHALEVKNSVQIRPEDLRGLKNFAEDFPESRRWLLYRGKERLLRDGILCVPCEEFLLQIKPNGFPT